MEDSNQKSHPPKNVCEKLYRAISVSTPIRNFRRISFPQHHETSPAKPSPIISDAEAAHNPPLAGAKLLRPKTEAIPVKVDSKTPSARNLRRGIQVTEVTSKNEDPASYKSNRTRPDQKPAPVQVIRQNKPGKIIEDRFTEFIDRAKLKMSLSNVGEDKISSTIPVADQKDHFSEYIRRAKQRLRTTSSTKLVKSESFKIESKRGA